MSLAINALLSESDDDDEDLLNDATQLLEEDEASKSTGRNLKLLSNLENLSLRFTLMAVAEQINVEGSPS